MEGATAKGNTTRVRDGDNAYLNISYKESASTDQ